MAILFVSSTPVNHESGANTGLLFIAVVGIVIAVVINQLGRSFNSYRHPETAAMNNHQRQLRRESLQSMVRGSLWLALLVPVMFVMLYAVIHTSSG
ncbi:hypothetical protein [Dactylosporangium darangshiense]|uniref:Uncharacterized protein n=1 Tax=Dactylosporangium darangshiense TaxID=579108 RepID=A0ABP8D7J6_9ACTN